MFFYPFAKLKFESKPRPVTIKEAEFMRVVADRFETKFLTPGERPISDSDISASLEALHQS